MLRTSLATGFVTVLIAASAMLAPATAQKPGDPKTNAAFNSSKSNTFKVTAVNASAGTFTATSKDGKEFTFTTPKGARPTVGKVYDITYTESPGGGPLLTKNLNSSRSNVN
jgi:hypothetical protein